MIGGVQGVQMVYKAATIAGVEDIRRGRGVKSGKLDWQILIS